MGGLFFLITVSFAFAITVLVLWTSISAILSANPETRYQPVLDDRSSFMKSQNNFSSELDALGATARNYATERTPVDDKDEVPVNARHEYRGNASNLSSHSAERHGFGMSDD